MRKQHRCVVVFLDFLLGLFWGIRQNWIIRIIQKCLPAQYKTNSSAVEECLKAQDLGHAAVEKTLIASVL